MEYWKPEHPPPTTDRRKPDGTGVCEPIISLTLAIADGVSTGAAVLGWVSGREVVVAIGLISLYVPIITKVVTIPARLFLGRPCNPIWQLDATGIKKSRRGLPTGL